MSLKRTKNILLIPAVVLALLSGTACGGQNTSSTFSVSYNNTTSSTASVAGDLPQYSNENVSLPYHDPHIVSSLDFSDPGFYYGQLKSDTEKQIYQSAVQALIGFAMQTNPVKVDDAFTKDQAGQIMQDVLFDYPQFFEVPFGYTAQIIKGNLSFSLSYGSFDKATLTAKRQTFYTAVNSILAEAAKISSVQQRELYLYDTVMQSGNYDYNELMHPGTDPLAHTAYGCLVNKQTVCDGYARAFALLANYSGISAGAVCGTIAGSQYHSWVEVKIDGKQYFCDPTFDDNEPKFIDSAGSVYTTMQKTAQMTSLPIAVTHMYYNLSYTQMAKNHLFDIQSFTDTAPVDADRYQAQKGTLFSSSKDLSAWLKTKITPAAKGSVLEFGVSYTTNKNEIESLLKQSNVKTYVDENGSETNFAIYIY